LSKSSFPLEAKFIDKALHWADQFQYACYLNPNGTRHYPSGPFLHVLAVGDQTPTIPGQCKSFEDLQSALNNCSDWLFGHLSYDLKNSIEDLSSSNKSFVEFPLTNFFKAKYLILFNENSIEIKAYGSLSEKDVYQDILDEIIETKPSSVSESKMGVTKEEYVDIVKKIIQHIEEGDVYEINYCFNYYIDYLDLDPIYFYKTLTRRSPTPFSSFYKNDTLYALGSSPERFLKKEKNKLISQPIKGTISRGNSQTEDELNKIALRNDEKELAENMMIVDLVRNDLAKSSISGSVKVDEMFGIYSFRHWHQMISTVSSIAKPGMQLFDIIKNAFPMGSMTGAPKVKVMELIEQYETFKRGLYSGAIGYLTPDGAFDFNVVIRTLFYDSLNKRGEFMVGSAITYDSIPEKEFEECQLKAQAIIETLQALAADQI